MKTTNFLLATVFCFLTIGINAQWEFQNPSPSNAFLNDIQFIDDNHGWAVGEFGTIIYSSNGGESWEEQHSNASTFHYIGAHSTFKSVCFIDLNTGWVAGSFDGGMAGYGGTLLHTSDGGNQWTEIFNGDGESFFDVCFTDAENGWLIGLTYQMLGFISHTDDGGISWSTIDTTMGDWPRKLCFVDEYNGWIVGDNGMILHTSDGGLNWISQGENIDIDIKSVCFTDINHGWIAGTYDNINAKLYATSNGGLTWDSIAEFDHQLCLGNIFFTDPDHGWITSAFDLHGVYLKRITNGIWHPYEYNFFPFQLYSPVTLYFNDPNKGWAVGENVIMTITDNGLVSEVENSITNLHLQSVVFTDPQNGWALGSTWNPGTGGYSRQNKIIHTNDGGNNWDSIIGGYTSYSEHLQSLFFIDQYHGWASGINPQGCFIIKTVDGGMNWERFYPDSINSWSRFGSLYFINAMIGWAIYNEWPANIDKVIFTNDGGYTWSEQYACWEDFHLNSLFFYNENTGWAVGRDTADYAYIINTVDGGNSWQEQISGSYGEIYSIQFINQDTGWAVGENTIIHTNDGGDNWEVQEYNTAHPYSTYRSVCFTNEDRGWIAGNKDVGNCLNSSVILFTDNGGNTWDIQLGRKGGQFNSICAVDQNNVWAVGNGGTILHTDNGGIAGIEKPTRTQYLSPEIITYPNPFHSSTTIEFELKANTPVTLHIYNHMGQQVAELLNESKAPGQHRLSWKAAHLPPGLYFLRLQAGNEVRTGKIIKQ